MSLKQLILFGGKRILCYDLNRIDTFWRFVSIAIKILPVPLLHRLVLVGPILEQTEQEEKSDMSSQLLIISYNLNPQMIFFDGIRNLI